MKRLKISAVSAVLIFSLLPLSAEAGSALIPVGQTVGLQLRDNTVTIAAFDDALGGNAKDAGLRIGDCIVSVNGKAVHNSDEVRRIVENAGQSVELCLRRGSKELTVNVKTASCADGKRLGIYLKQGISGIGTVTWYDPISGRFGALGHGVNDSGGVLMKMEEGSTYPAEVLSVTKGKSGHPGQLKGTCDSNSSCGEIFRNTPQGVFGKTRMGWNGDPLPIATPEQLHTGPAIIRSTVSGCKTQDYSAEIVKVYPASRADGRNLLLKITDPLLLDATGGIVQGMSGSPILQDGRLIGAVTHVLVNDPTMGYGIYIGNMLDAAA